MKKLLIILSIVVALLAQGSGIAFALPFDPPHLTRLVIQAATTSGVYVGPSRHMTCGFGIPGTARYDIEGSVDGDTDIPWLDLIANQSASGTVAIAVTSTPFSYIRATPDTYTNGASSTINCLTFGP